MKHKTSEESSSQKPRFSNKIKFLLGSLITVVTVGIAGLIYKKTRFSPEISHYDISVMGTRKGKTENEDRYCAIPDYGLGPFYGIFDGHKGGAIADKLASKLPDVIKRKKEENPDASMQELFTQSFQEIDYDLKNQNIERKFDYAASTALCMLVQDNKLVFANTGNSRAVLSREKQAEQITADHTLHDEKEKKRVQDIGGVFSALYSPPMWSPKDNVSHWFYLTRAFGRFSAKDKGLIVDPEVVERPLSPDVEFVVLASDWLFTALTNQQVINLVHEQLQKGVDPASIPQKLVNEARLGFLENSDLEGSEDDITIIIVFFHPIDKLRSP